MQQNLLVNPYLPYNLEDLLFEKQSVLEPIANNANLSAARRADAMSRIVMIDDVLTVLEGAAAMGFLDENPKKTAAQVIEEVMGKPLSVLQQNPTIAAVAGKAIGSGARTVKGWLNKSAEWVAEKTK